MCYNEIELCAQNIDSILGSTMNITLGGLVSSFKELYESKVNKGLVFTLDSYSFWNDNLL